jgi:hypothetical protein
MTRRKKLLVLASLAAMLIAAGSAFIVWASGPISLERDEAGRVRSCGVRTSADGRTYCASELAAKNPQAMHRCPGHDGAVVVKHVDENGEDSGREICCICGLIQRYPQPHSDMTLDAIHEALTRDPVCLQPGASCPRNGRVGCAKPRAK